MLLVVPTEEQQAACEMFAGGGDLALVAGAGTGKTATLVLMAATTRRRGMYLAYNRAIANDARRRFGPNVTCSTAHSVAYRATGKQYRERLNTSARIPGPQAARLLGITRDLGIGSAAITCGRTPSGRGRTSATRAAGCGSSPTTT
jgi:superfamily I DNA/RNA helicase